MPEDPDAGPARPAPTPARLPTGRLVRSRVVTDLGSVLADALERRLDGYAVVEPQDALLLDAGGACTLGFRGGVPVGAHHTGTSHGGSAALADLAAEGPYRVELHALAGERRQADPLRAFDADGVRVAAVMPAERLAGDQALAARTRRVLDEGGRVGGRGAPAPASGSARPSPGERDEPDPVVAFLEDEQKIAAIREQAREQARERAEQWGLSDHLEDG